MISSAKLFHDNEENIDNHVTVGINEAIGSKLGNSNL